MKKIGFIYSKNYYVLAFFILLFTAIFFRFQGVITNSFPFTYDIGRDLIAAREIATFEKIPLIGQTTGLPGLFYGPSWYYILAALYYPLQGDPQLFTGFIASTGVLMVILAFLLGKKIGGILFAFLWAGLLAVSPVVISLTQQIWNPNLIPIFWIASYVVLYLIFIRKRVLLSFFVLGILLALIADMEIVVGLLYGAGITVSLFLVKQKLLSIKAIAAGLVGFLLVVLPRVVFDFRHEHILSKTLLNGFMHMFVKGGEGSSTTPMMQKIQTLFSLWADTLALENRLFGGVILAVIIIATLLIYKRVKSEMKFFLNTTLLSLLITVIGLLFFGHDIWGHYLVIIPLLYITWVSLVIAGLYRSKKHSTKVVIFAIALIVINLNPVNLYKSITSPLWEGDAAVYRNQLAVVDYVYKKADGRPFKFIVYTPPVHDFTYRYLFSWYGNKIHKAPPVDKAGIMFVILEPDIEQPQRLKDWLQVREKDGIIIEQSKQKGGIVVQTREVN